MTALRSIVALSVAALAVGLGLHLAGVAFGDRLITAGLIALVAMPVVNVAIVLAQEVRRQHWGFVAAAVGVIAGLTYAIWQ